MRRCSCQPSASWMTGSSVAVCCSVWAGELLASVRARPSPCCSAGTGRSCFSFSPCLAECCCSPRWNAGALADREVFMKVNVGTIDRALRIVVGLVLIGLSLGGVIGAWGWIGLLPLARSEEHTSELQSL